MARRRRGRPVHGWMVVDKPSGVTSARAVDIVRRSIDAAKAGHGGTLDPLATGVLPVALGEATKTVPYLVDERKSYRFRIRWGESHDTDDVEGKVTDVSDVRPTAQQIREVLPRFRGEIDQVPPHYSAVKVNGRRAYDLARADVPVDLPPRRVTVERFELLDIPDADHAEFEVVSGKGTYMRALARDVAVALGTLGCVDALRRTAVGPFTEDGAIPLDNIRTLGHSAALMEHVLAVETALAGIPALVLTEGEARRLHSGQAVAVLPVARRQGQRLPSKDGIVFATAAEKPIAVARIHGGELRPLRVLNL